ncbi:DUF7694 domain-containing protein [Sagittula salina]|uniref:DUF7694 domain-containing protein n=1 Tax=Sagittula salina TaxID=2820268 RepID=A0A940MLD6_9RHOB|nr:hypothetical protein [Sagittula salina]MBP0483955.1 hypothetical protein [Sagittula salina]
MTEPRTLTLLGYPVTIDDAVGHLCVEHEGQLTWDQLFEIKNTVWGPEARAVEIYPRCSRLVNQICARHLWRLGEGDFAPDLLNRDGRLSAPGEDALEDRFNAAWEGAST